MPARKRPSKKGESKGHLSWQREQGPPRGRPFNSNTFSPRSGKRSKFIPSEEEWFRSTACRISLREGLQPLRGRK
jgi:hypothetical protein